jgi:hypothetical protein
VASLVGRLITLRSRGFGQAREQKPLVPGAAGESKIMLLREVDGPSNLNVQVRPGEGLIKFHSAQHAGA